MMFFVWYTGPQTSRCYGVCYGKFAWPSRSEWFVPGTWED